MEELRNVRCRLCFQKKFQLLPMFPANEPVNDDLLRKIRECASVMIVYEDDQNSMICIKCIVDVEQFYSFKERCIQTDLHVQQMRQEPCMLMDEPPFVEPETTYEHALTPQVHMEGFIGPTKLIRVGYNYRVVRVNEKTDVLIHRRHRYYQPEENANCNSWACVARGTVDCPAQLTISSSVRFPQALFNRRVKHNHPEAIVQAVGVIEPYSEEIVKLRQKYMLVTNSQQQLRLLADRYLYRLSRAISKKGMSVWVCERSKPSGCSATVMLSYEDEKLILVGDQTHDHDKEPDESLPYRTSLNNVALMAQEQTEEKTYQHGYNYKIIDGSLLFRGNFFKPGKSNSSPAKIVWNCTQNNCTVKVRVRRKMAALVKNDHDHPAAISRKQTTLAEETLQQGVNYRLILDKTGYIRLWHRKQKYYVDKLRKNSITEWVCTWERLGCTAVVKMDPEEQFVFGSTDKEHHHRIRNALEQYFLPAALNTTPSRETVLWSCSDYELLWNSRCKPIVRREGLRYYAKKAYCNGTVYWQCTRGVATHCDASITIDKTGKIKCESPIHDHQRLRKRPSKTRSAEGGSVLEGTVTTTAVFNSPGPVHLAAGGFNYQRMMNVQLNIEIVVHYAHTYLSDNTANTYHCIMRDEPKHCPGKIVLTNNALYAELSVPHNHLTRAVPRIAQPDRLSQVTVEGPNFELIYSMTGQNCLLMYEGYTFSMYKLLVPSQSSRWRCVQAEAGCKAYLYLPVSLTKPATSNGVQHDHSLAISSVQLDSDDTTVSQELCSVEVKVEEPPENQPHTRNAYAGAVASDKKTKVATSAPCTRMLTVKRELSIKMSEHQHQRVEEPMNEANALTYFLHGHLYVRDIEGLLLMTAEDEKMDWICAFHWTLSCEAGLGDLSVHNHDRFASVSTNDRFSMLKILLGQGIIAQRGPIAQMPELQVVSEYELLPSNGNLSLSIDNHRYYFYKAKNNGEWLWRCVRHRWQGCKIGVAVSHCFGKYYFQPYGTTEHEHQ